MFFKRIKLTIARFETGRYCGFSDGFKYLFFRIDLNNESKSGGVIYSCEEREGHLKT